MDNNLIAACNLIMMPVQKQNSLGEQHFSTSKQVCTNNTLIGTTAGLKRPNGLEQFSDYSDIGGIIAHAFVIY